MFAVSLRRATPRRKLGAMAHSGQFDLPPGWTNFEPVANMHTAKCFHQKIKSELVIRPPKLATAIRFTPEVI